MDSKKFIREELTAFIERFSKTRVRYEYDPNARVHIVEVLPNEVYSLDSYESILYIKYVFRKRYFKCSII